MRYNLTNTKKLASAYLCFLSWLVLVLSCPSLWAEEPDRTFTLKQSIQEALKASAALHSDEEGIMAAEAVKKKRTAYFLPTLSAKYQYTRNYEECPTTPENKYSFITSFDQPLFKGFSLITEYRIAKLGLDIAKIRKEQTSQDIILDVKKAYFSLLQAQKLYEIALQAVTQIKAHEEIARSFYDVGMTVKTDVLQAEVELANARQDLITAKNNVEIAKSLFNTVLRRPINASVKLEDILSYTSFDHDLQYCFDAAEKKRVEKQVADLEVEVAEKNVRLTRKDYFPSISLQGNYYKYGDDPVCKGGDKISDPDSWNILAVASWNFWEWGKSHYDVKEKLNRLSQAKDAGTQILDNIRLEVKRAYLNMKQAEKNIATVKKAIEQAEENLRMNEERYREQVATSTDVLDAQTLLSRTKTNYYNALSAFNISKAELYRSMGIGKIEE